MSHATRLFIPMASCPVELRKKLKLDTAMGAFYVDDPSDTQLDWLLAKDLVTREAVDLLRGFRDFDPAALAVEMNSSRDGHPLGVTR
jgi:hypothetical protein